jgi:hypothetical protein
MKPLILSQSTPVDVFPSEPSSPQVVFQTPAEDPITGPPAPSRHLTKDLKIEVPHEYLRQAEVHALLQMAAKLVSESLHTAIKKSELDLLRKGHRERLAAAAINCNSHLCSLIDDNAVKYQPGIPGFVTDIDRIT